MNHARVLVTGGGGFIGRHLVERLVAQGEPVRVIGRKAYPELERVGVETVRGDLGDLAAVERACDGISVVYHVAACVGAAPSAREMKRTNVLGTKNLLEACKARGVSRLVFTSSASVVFGSEDQEGVDESAPYPARYTSVYAETKAQAERLVLSENGREGLRTTSLRPHLVWGPGDSHLPAFVARAKSRGMVQVGDGKNRVDVTYVENLVDAHLLASERLLGEGEAQGRAFFISQGEPVVLWDFFASLLDRLAIARPRRTLSYRKAYALGAASELVWRLLRRDGAPPLTRFLAAQMAKNHFFDLSAARNVLGYQPRVSTEQGLERLVAALVASA